MMKLSILWLTLLAFLLAQVTAEGFEVPQVWENLNFTRQVDVSRVYGREKILLDVKNVGKEDATEYFMALPIDLLNKISVVTSIIKDRETFPDTLLTKNITILDDGSKIGYVKMVLPEPAAAKEEISIIVTLEYNARGVPYPESIGLNEEQHLLLTTNKLPLSAYLTKESTLLFIGSSSFEEINGPSDESLKGEEGENSISFGPFKNTKAYTNDNKVKLKYLHNVPLNVVTTLKRDLWISHWGSVVQFQEYYELTNRAAKLNKGFSRLEHMKQMQQTLNGHYRGILDNILPTGATDHYYTDLVGMVSTSQIKGAHFYLKPRYPIYGGWKYNYTIGWTNELSDFVHSIDNNSFILSAPLLNGPVDTAYDTVELSLYLPEGAIVEEIDSPLPYEKVSIDTEKSYFDLNKGHVKVTFTFNNLIDELRGGKVLIKYQYDNVAFYKKPLSIATYIFVALLSIFTLNQINIRVN
ncbi:hypothetical protein TPHA_0N00730 [Tetrapisispora phaffii CBS 4417]|uniref:Dolichyl-diphosphooligosaccharide--protein glycosyltransferase subunit 1 n=1 Tax=Tetrapisispora phaffii (strain ATCC 24235 / CBS 4417 / NBRC 1672 / NRRL Y-8282 / UCD 70-5) TaxID=1071381 RepID=G8C126_TETPH|nr:hypothetical protein TPHA_0N00730 [Tetrapisispora phaffii CBS 4417]CCE65854.1 hypothetical protein TPHA_0N00730 [Tetrapisispora phaffii CBS 4417]